jgi:hypothetical protein
MKNTIFIEEIVIIVISLIVVNQLISLLLTKI